jgi:hypothetical protein
MFNSLIIDFKKGVAGKALLAAAVKCTGVSALGL